MPDRSWQHSITVLRENYRRQAIGQLPSMDVMWRGYLSAGIVNDKLQSRDSSGSHQVDMWQDWNRAGGI